MSDVIDLAGAPEEDGARNGGRRDYRLVSRGQFLRAAAGSAGFLVLGSRASGATRPFDRAPRTIEASARQVRSFHSRPDLHPPAMTVADPSVQASPSEGYAFLGPTSGGGAQSGALIADAAGQPVWFAPVPFGRWVTNFRVQQYNGQPVLTWWEGTVSPPGYGHGEGIIVDSSYAEIARVRARNGRQIDLHEFVLTPEGTALVTCYPQVVDADLSQVGGARDGQVFESIIQEIDVRTGRLLHEWRSLDHVSISESYLPAGGVYDYVHINSIDVTADGNLLVSGRHTCALYKLGRRGGRVMWRLGGKRSHFAMARGSRFAWQHDARAVAPGTITLFDDGAGPLRTHSQSRGLVLQYDSVHPTVRLVRAYRHPKRPLLAYAMGNMQMLPDGNVMVGWGNVPVLSEFAADGSLLADQSLPWANPSYRGYRMPWSGAPADPPAVAATVDSATDSSTLYVSWNGATGVSSWQVSAGPGPSALTPVGIAPRTGFETAIPLGTASGYAAVTALDQAGQPLASSTPIRL